MKGFADYISRARIHWVRGLSGGTEDSSGAFLALLREGLVGRWVRWHGFGRGVGYVFGG
jgi:hypothetical protein